jgi:site-specific recombinase XerD
MAFHVEEAGKSPVHVQVKGPLAPLADDLREELARRGYTPRSTNDYLGLVSRLSRWLEGRGTSADELTVAVVEEFFQSRKAQGRRKSLTPRSVSALLSCMRIERAAGGLAVGTPFEALLVAYREYLLAERGLAASTVAQYLRHAQIFLSWLPQPAGASLASLSAGQVTTFPARSAPIPPMSWPQCAI